MNKHIVIVLFLMQSIAAMEEPPKQQKAHALQEYKARRNSLFCGMCFFNQNDSEQEKETYFVKLKELYGLHKQEVCIGCTLCTTATAIACCAIPYACDSQFCYDYPAGWICCCIIKCGAIGANAAIADKVINNCCNYWKTRKVVNQVAGVKQLRPISVKVEKVE
jgi:hypothetical protein